MSVASGQRRTFLRLIDALRPHWRRDQALPARIQGQFAQHKEFGSRDRRLYRELIYTTLRYLPWIEPLLDQEPERAAKIAAWLAADNRDTARYRAELAGDWPVANTLAERAAVLAADPTALLPGWFRHERPELFDAPELDAQLARAPLWLRLQTPDTAGVAAEFESKQWRWRESPILNSAWQIRDEADVTRAECFARGAFEVQDLGSQLLLESIGIETGGRWLDACAGAGGKTLQLARLLGTSGQVDAHDIRRAALDELAIRASRAGGLRTVSGGAKADIILGVRNAATIRLLEGSPAASRDAGAGGAVPAYDGVLVDAPCSGSGTWRRSPHLKWTTTPELVADRARLQQQLLARYAPLVKPGGRLVYATCSLALTENEAVVVAFLAQHEDFDGADFARTFGFTPRASGLTILPARHDSDGFFVASLRRQTR